MTTGTTGWTLFTTKGAAWTVVLTTGAKTGSTIEALPWTWVILWWETAEGEEWTTWPTLAKAGSWTTWWVATKPAEATEIRHKEAKMATYKEEARKKGLRGNYINILRILLTYEFEHFVY